MGAAIDPFHLSVSPPSQEGTRSFSCSWLAEYDHATDSLRILTSRFPTDGDPTAAPHAYHPALAQLYAQYANALYSICSPFTRDPHELSYVAAAQWPSFVAPVLEAQKGTTEIHSIPEDVRLRLLRVFLPSFSAALEALLPRRTHARAWSRTLDLNEGAGVDDKNVGIVTRSLPTLQKYILLSAFLASSNPPRTDMRMFSRNREARSKRRGGGTRKAPHRSSSAPAKVSSLFLPYHAKLIANYCLFKLPQRLVGPAAFPLDRMNAILATLLEEHDLETRAIGPEFTQPGEYTETELMRVHTSGAVRVFLPQLNSCGCVLAALICRRQDCRTCRRASPTTCLPTRAP
jgi:origin recognition complex subunit 5